MKISAILFVLCAALPASALAQAAEDPLPTTDPVLSTKWTLKQPRKKAMAVKTVKKTQTASAKMGPAVPRAQRLKVPRSTYRAPTNTVVRQSNPSAAPLFQAIQHSARRRGNN